MLARKRSGIVGWPVRKCFLIVRGVRPSNGGPCASTWLVVALRLVRAFRGAGVSDATGGRIDRGDYRVGAAGNASVAGLAPALAARVGLRRQPDARGSAGNKPILFDHPTPYYAAIIPSSH